MTTKQKYENMAKKFGWIYKEEIVGTVVRFFWVNKNGKRFNPKFNISKSTFAYQANI